MKRLIAMTSLALGSAAVGAGLPGSFEAEVVPVLEKNCMDCHSDAKEKGGVNLEPFNNGASVWRDPKLWEKVREQVDKKLMPPPKREQQPNEEERKKVTAWLDKKLGQLNPPDFPTDPGRKPPHRLNREEYNNTVGDLLDVTLRPADEFPPDGGGGAGFDNTAATLYTPPLLMEKLLAAATKLIAAAKAERIFPVRPGPGVDERAAAQKCIEWLGGRAFRRPMLAEETARHLALYDGARKGGASWEDGLRAAHTALLVSPHFLYRIEADRPGSGPQRLSDWELAARLSYFLWSTMPDDELLRLASMGQLNQPATLDAQVKRMIAHPKARRFAAAFASQWLRTKELAEDVHPSPDKFPQFTPALRDAMAGEPVEFFHGLLRENRALTECLDADYTYANETLAKFYGLAGVTGGEFRRVALTDKNRGGVLGMAGVLALTSYPRRTSPVLRGKWVLEEILGTPTPPPPPLVNTQKLASDRVEDGLTFRQRLEQHRSNPSCAGCHARMDPLGFALENYDPIGNWRTDVRGTAVDSAGELISGEKFNGPVEMKKLLMQRRDQFTRNVTEKMLAYALGRELGPHDWLTARRIAAATAADGYRTQRLVTEITRSLPFLHRRPASAPKTAER